MFLICLERETIKIMLYIIRKIFRYFKQGRYIEMTLNVGEELTESISILPKLYIVKATAIVV
jgi:hypothetical protein